MSKIRIITMVIATYLLVGCGTVAGLGTDIKGAADWTKEKIEGTKL
jgi:predicted small secreted protein